MMESAKGTVICMSMSWRFISRNNRLGTMEVKQLLGVLSVWIANSRISKGIVIGKA